ncbi:AAA family ATPase [Candidatus Korarchaeum cryptofilum]|jgi:cell division control protein 6|uniref:ORC1-type DNA replication protein n=2 Tax=Candidatus Korarchaeum cryptofilum TaxID=498846 RepID=B1L6Q1_KORCO|nr:AAA family ATPase [Candidatus Korarchaeum cryptofilum]ACB08130.1 orc1/cdc6 family replication initiation protein [Candidatus Korarchaeum cryptofilum OPF8]RSN68402.1 AAA family ATPase [Candidatus Korarchaeum cryptofilum]
MPINNSIFYDTSYVSYSIIKDKRVLRDSFIPDTLPGREEQIFLFTRALSDLLSDQPPSDVAFIGKPGTGKTAVVKNVSGKFKQEYPNLRAKFVYINCSQASTSYRVMYQLNRALGVLVPPSGYPFDVLWDKFIEAYSSSNSRLIVILDEVDLLVRRDGGRILYSLSRLNYELGGDLSISMVVISNTLDFLERLDPRERSSFEPLRIHFPPYTQPQLYNILRQRADLGIKLGTWDDEALHLIAARVAQESGDARRAIDVLRIAAEIAEDEKAEKLTVKHVEKALNSVNEEEISVTVRTLPLHHRLILAAIAEILERPQVRPGTGVIYSVYGKRALSYGVKPLTMRRVSGILRELESLGLVEIKMDYGGARGNTKVVERMALPPEQMKSLLFQMGIRI